MTNNIEQHEEPFMHHIAILRTCLIRSLLAAILCLVLTTYYAKEIYHYISLPMLKILPEGSHFITTHPIEAWATYFKTALFAALFMASPVLIFQVWSFVAPGLRLSEKKTTLAAIMASSVLFVFGGLFGYFVAFPFGFGYLSSVLTNTDILYLPRMEDYLSFAFQLLLGFGLIFETPLAIILLVFLGIVDVASLRAFRCYYIVLAFAVAAVLTPPDVVSQIIMGVPLLVLYEVGVFGAWLVQRKTHLAST